MAASEERSRPRELGRRYLLRSKLGSGERKDVYSALDTEVNGEVAIGLIRDPDKSARDAVQREARIMGPLRDLPGIVPVYGCKADGKRVYLVTALMSGGTLAAPARSDDDIPAIDIIRWSLGMASSVAQLHAQKVVHNDVKLKNFWLDEQQRVFLGDFDLAAHIGDPRPALADLLTTAACAAPELALPGIACTSSDSFALGASMLDLASGEAPSRKNGSNGSSRVSHQISQMRVRRSDLPEAYPTLIGELLDPDPGMRPSAADARARLRQLLDDASRSADINLMITEGEGHHREFKESFFSPDPEGPSEPDSRLSKALEEHCARAVAGFMNADGGVLLVGVRDNHDVVGIERDLDALHVSRPNESIRDKWQRRFEQYMKKTLRHPVGALDVSFVAINNRTIAIVRCRSVRDCVFLQDALYVREGAKTLRLSMQDAIDYGHRRKTGAVA